MSSVERTQLRHTQPLWLRVREEGDGPAQTASLILKRLEIQTLPIPVEGILTQLGVTVVRVPSASWSGAVVSSSSDATVYVNASEAPVRQRFTLAHELGHLMLHPLGTEYRDHEFSGGGPRETQANQFAAALLMPMWLVEQARRARGTNGAVLCKLFDVSERAMTIRLEQLAGVPNEWE